MSVKEGDIYTVCGGVQLIMIKKVGVVAGQDVVVIDYIDNYDDDRYRLMGCDVMVSKDVLDAIYVPYSYDKDLKLIRMSLL